MKRVVITGMGTINPLGNNVPQFCEGLKEGRLGISKIDQFDCSDFDVKCVGAVKDFDPLTAIDKKESRRMDRFTQFAVCAADEALKDAGSDFKDVDPYRAGVIIGVGIGGLNLTEQEHAKFLAKPDKISVFYIPMMIANMAAGTVSMKTGFKGDNYATVTACASGTHAVGEAFRKIKDGYLDVAIAGGAESCISRFALAGFNNMKALSREEDPEKASTPFDLNRKGFVLGEGCGILVLEEYEHAKARGAKIYAEVAGYGATCDAHHITAPLADGSGGAKAMAMALTDGGVAPEQVGYINAHGTSTHLNDAGETAAVKTVFGPHAYQLAMSSTKSMTGHMLGAAGAVEAIFTALSLWDGFLPATIHYQTPDPDCDLDVVPNEGRPADIRYALSNSLGFGGHNGSLLLKKWED